MGSLFTCRLALRTNPGPGAVRDVAVGWLGGAGRCTSRSAREHDTRVYRMDISGGLTTLQIGVASNSPRPPATTAPHPHRWAPAHVSRYLLPADSGHWGHTSCTRGAMAARERRGLRRGVGRQRVHATAGHLPAGPAPQRSDRQPPPRRVCPRHRAGPAHRRPALGSVRPPGPRPARARRPHRVCGARRRRRLGRATVRRPGLLRPRTRSRDGRGDGVDQGALDGPFDTDADAGAARGARRWC
jgi:hypothetical protein